MDGQTLDRQRGGSAGSRDILLTINPLSVSFPPISFVVF